MPAVMLAEVHRRLELPVSGSEELRAHEDVPGKVEAELGRDPRQREDEHRDRDDEPRGVPGKPRLKRRPIPPAGRNRQPERRARPRPPARCCRQRALRCDWLTNRGIVAQSAIAGPATHHARRGSDRIATSASTIATSAKGQLVWTSARLRPSREAAAAHVVELGRRRFGSRSRRRPRASAPRRSRRPRPRRAHPVSSCNRTPRPRAARKLRTAVARLFLSPPHLSGTELERVREAIESNWIAPLGPQVDAFEQELAAATDATSVLALSSGTAAIHLALLVHGIGPGDEVGCSSLTFAASANPIVYSGATPFFVDCDDTWLIDPTLLDEAITARKQAGARVRAVISVDLYGTLLRLRGTGRGLRAARRGADPGRRRVARARPIAARTRGRRPARGALASTGTRSSRQAAAARSRRPMLACSRTPASSRPRPVSRCRTTSTPRSASTTGSATSSRPSGARSWPCFPSASRRAGGSTPATATCWPTRPASSSCPTGPTAHRTAGSRASPSIPAAFGADREQIRVALEAEDIEARPVWKPMHLQPVFAGQPDVRRRRLRSPVRPRPLPAERLGDDRGRSGSRRRDPDLATRSLTLRDGRR